MDDRARRIEGTSLEQGSRESLQLSALDSGILIHTPSVFTRIRFSRAQATALRDALSTLLEETTPQRDVSR